MHDTRMVNSPHINNGELVRDVFMTSKVPDVFFQLLTQHQELVQFGDMEEVFCTRSKDPGGSGLVR